MVQSFTIGNSPTPINRFHQELKQIYSVTKPEFVEALGLETKELVASTPSLLYYH
jgi:hypothetical protein